jgi:hypothetical protein
MRCKCCLQIRPTWLEHNGRYYCSYDCAEAWAEHTESPSLMQAARVKQSEERKAS